MNQNPIYSAFGKPSDDALYWAKVPLQISLILRLDSYKLGHPWLYNPDIEATASYGGTRLPYSEETVFAGMQLLLNTYMSERITHAQIDAAEEFAINHFGVPGLLHRAAYEMIADNYDGYMPVVIRSVDEGQVLPGGIPQYAVLSDAHPILAFLGPALETIIQRGIWYPSVIATDDRNIKQDTLHYYEMSGADMGMLWFSLHDFGGRGVSSPETAEIGGCYHTFNYMGSDTVEGIVTANYYYDADMSAYSVLATEHSIETSWGPTVENENAYIRHALKTAIEKGVKIVSIVVDGYDTIRCVNAICAMRDEIIASGVKVVVRPDSGDPMVIVPQILELLEKAFGVEYTSTGHKRIKHVGVLQGDGVDRLLIKNLLGRIVCGMNYSADVIVFGSGGALLQKKHRDMQKYAQKLSAFLVDGKWIGAAKDPITDPGKKSLEGVLTSIYNPETKQYSPHRLDLGPIPEGCVDLMKVRYYYGELYNKTTLAEIRGRLDAAQKAV